MKRALSHKHTVLHNRIEYLQKKLCPDETTLEYLNKLLILAGLLILSSSLSVIGRNIVPILYTKTKPRYL